MARSASANIRGMFANPKRVGEPPEEVQPINDPATGVTYGEPVTLGRQGNDNAAQTPAQDNPAPESRSE